MALSPRRVVTLHRWQIIAAFFILTVSFVVGLWLVVHLNNERVRDIQESRIESCVRTYDGVRQVALRLVLIQKPPTRQQLLFVRRLNAIVAELQSHCPAQTGQKGE